MTFKEGGGSEKFLKKVYIFADFVISEPSLSPSPPKAGNFSNYFSTLKGGGRV
jgi:hypothetical protein